MREVNFRAELQLEPCKWSRIEIEFLLRFYPKYKEGNLDTTAGFIRGHLHNRTMIAISNKYWSIMGSEKKEKIAKNQFEFDFYRKKLELKKERL